MTVCSSFLHRLVIFFPPLTVCHVNNCGANYVILRDLRIFHNISFNTKKFVIKKEKKKKVESINRETKRSCTGYSRVKSGLH